MFEPVEVIRLDNVSVNYRSPDQKIRSIKEYTVQLLRGKLTTKTFQALKNVSLTVQKGEVFGLVGPNGAGKSTLLKLIARVLRPSFGKVWVQGRISPLLEVGAGFHPELTGRENVYLNGAILGYNRKEMESEMDAIVDFAELHGFIDAPLRTYSSGMWARLGFAVATAFKPDILIIDEILSVGDEVFQRKSLERIQQFRSTGTTILLVSHNTMTIETMCQSAAWLDQGVVKAIGSSAEVVARYLNHVSERMGSELESKKYQPKPPHRWGSQLAKIQNVRFLDDLGIEKEVFQTGEGLTLELNYSAMKKISSPIFGIAVHNQDGIQITGPNTFFSNYPLPSISGEGTIQFHIPRLPLLSGKYQFSVAIVTPENAILDFHERLYPFRVVNSPQGTKEQYGLITLFGEWKLVD